MPDDRLLHARQSQSEKVSALDDLTYRVWIATLLHADDYGVLPASPATLRGQVLALQRRSEGEISASLDTLCVIGLILRFEHQGREWLVHPLWQDYQKVSYPRNTYYPSPPPEVFQKLSRRTSQAFRKRSTKISRNLPLPLAVSRKPLAVSLKTETAPPLNGSDPLHEPTDPDERRQWLATPYGVLAWLNKKAGRSFRPEPTHLSLIAARIASGITPAQLRIIVSNKVEEWNHEPRPGERDMRKYLRPATLFGKEKCEQYVGELTRGEEAE